MQDRIRKLASLSVLPLVVLTSVGTYIFLDQRKLKEQNALADELKALESAYWSGDRRTKEDAFTKWGAFIILNQDKPNVPAEILAASGKRWKAEYLARKK